MSKTLIFGIGMLFGAGFAAYILLAVERGSWEAPAPSVAQPLPSRAAVTPEFDPLPPAPASSAADSWSPASRTESDSAADVATTADATKLERAIAQASLAAPVADRTMPSTSAALKVAAQASPANLLPMGSLIIPVAGIRADQLTDNFSDRRDGARPHEALDIMAPRGTPVLAAADGKIVKLFHSKPGGLTLYEFDAEESVAYYYAHLDRYAAGITADLQVKQGEVIGYVGSSGNASADAPHLHFGIFRLGPGRHWWQGTPINPYPLLAGQQALRNHR